MKTVIDAHHHFWTYSPAQYPWIDAAKSALRRDFVPADLKAEIAPAGIDGVISVQARQSIAETNWLLELARNHDFIRGVVGWAPLIDYATLRKNLDQWANEKKLLGLRHVLQDEPDDRYMLRDDFNAGVSMLKEYGLRYDILIFEHQLRGTIEFVDRHPDQIFIVDHVAKPKIIGGDFALWRSQMFELARRQRVFCKVSGMVTEADWKTWTPAELKPYFDVVLEAFGASRLMFGSDWPVCLLANGYRKWVQTVRDWTAPLSQQEQESIWGVTAGTAYGL